MEVQPEFDFGSFMADSLCLESYTNPAVRNDLLKPFQNVYQRYFNQDPLKVLGENHFKIPEIIPKEVRGTEIQEFYRDAHILITGGTGFLGKLLTEKLVRSIPHLGHIYLLIRTKRGKSPQERLEHLLEDKVFRRMREEVPWYHSKVTAMAGDLHEPGLGLSAADRQLLTDQVQVVFHSAADVSFTQPLKQAIEANVIGTRKVMNLSLEITNLKACIYVSTAFSQCVRRVTPETIPRMNIPYKDILSFVESHTDDKSDPEVIRLMQAWPNAYAFSKALCEIMLDEEYRTLPLSIIRPSVIFPTYNEPVRAWTDNLYGPLAILALASMGVLHCYHCDEELSLDIVPADYVINAMIVTAKETGTNRSDEIQVYNFTTQSPQRRWSWKQVNSVTTESARFWPLKSTYWYLTYQNHRNRTIYDIKHFVYHKTPAWIMDRVLALMGTESRLVQACQKLDNVKSSLEYMSFNCFQFENHNMYGLWCSMKEDDKSVFNFDTSTYSVLDSVAILPLGLKYYFFKDDLDSLPAAKRRQQWLYWLHTSVKKAFWFGVLTVAARLSHFVPI